ncbi:hypothetical protein ACFVXW_24090 [Streptomyces sp. NPDC058251]|uniref:hypothetical protein n=1 Tax=unclassified Streptomyces TaxID=2593676 RepID=UPI003663423F
MRKSTRGRARLAALVSSAVLVTGMAGVAAPAAAAAPQATATTVGAVAPADGPGHVLGSLLTLVHNLLTSTLGAVAG